MTVSVGAEFRAFTAKTCVAFDTRELNREAEARKRRELQKQSASKGTSRSVDQGASSAESGSWTTSNDQSASEGTTSIPSSKTHCGNGPRRRKFNLNIYKYHALGDYGRTILRCGTTDSFSTEPVSNY
jgi:hypothetical protein